MLTERERRFVEAYMGDAAGNGTEAARLAGYKGSAKVLQVQASRLLSKAIVRSAIDARQAEKSRASIADEIERDEELTVIVRSKDVDPRVKIQAISEMNRCGGRHLTRHEHSGPGGAPILTRVIHTFTDGPPGD